MRTIDCDNKWVVGSLIANGVLLLILFVSVVDSVVMRNRMSRSMTVISSQQEAIEKQKGLIKDLIELVEEGQRGQRALLDQRETRERTRRRFGLE